MEEELVLVARKACFGLPTACSSCLPVYIYLRFAKVPFQLSFNLIHADSDKIPYVEHGDYVAYNNEKGGVIEGLKEDGIVDLDLGMPSHTFPEWLSTKVMISEWLGDAVMYEIWAGSDGSAAHKIYFSDLPWPVGKILNFKEKYETMKLLGITKNNAERREAEIYRRATIAYEALSTRLGEQKFFFENRPTSLDASFLGHALFTLQALHDSSILRSKLLEHSNLVRYSENLKMEFLEDGSSSSPAPRSPFDASSSSTPRRGISSSWSSKPKSKPKKEKTEEEKTFRRRAKYFLAAQFVAVLVFLSIMGGSDDADIDMDDDGLNYDG